MKTLLPSLIVLLQTAAIATAQTTAIPAPPKPNLPATGTSTPASTATAEPETEYIHFLVAPGASAPGVEAPKPDTAKPEAPVAAAEPDRLQTAIVRFEKDGTIVDLVGVVHLADAAYFAALNERLKGYDAVLYEMVGGPHHPDKATADAASGSAAAEEVGSVRQLQQLAKAFFGLEYQLDGIDYSAPNFIHADVAWEEMDKLMKARNETLLTLFTRAMSLPEDAEVPGIPSDEAAAEEMVNRLFSAVLTGDSAGLKRTIAPFLSEAEHFIAHLEGEDGTVIVRERNRVVIEKLGEVRKDKGRGKYAIFYGAGHMPDLEKRLLADGFRKGEMVWLDAWTIPAPGAPGAKPAGSPMESILRLLSTNPEVMTGLQDLGTTLEDLGGALKSLTPPPAP